MQFLNNNDYLCTGKDLIFAILMRYKKWLTFIGGILVLLSLYCIFYEERSKDEKCKIVVCIPVFGQSYALGEEALRITNFDSLRLKYNGRIVTEKLDYTFGYFDHSSQFKQWVKRIFHYDKKAYELSVYSMAENLASKLGEDTIICIFPGGHGMNTIEQLMKPSDPYNKFIKEIATAYKIAQERGLEFYVPAVCWMQGESDIVEYPNYDYKEYFHRMYNDLNTDIKQVTHQIDDIRIICYQSSTVTKGLRYKYNSYNATEPQTPTAQMELIRDDTLVWASGPTYPYDFVNESLHIDAVGQRKIGLLAAKSALGIIRNEKREIGLVPMSYEIDGNNIRIVFNVPSPPLCFDTINVNKVDNYGFNVIRRDGVDVVMNVMIEKGTIIIHCSESPKYCKLRYGINGEFLKGGRRVGPRGNLRDSEMRIPNWCLIFELLLN